MNHTRHQTHVTDCVGSDTSVFGVISSSQANQDEQSSLREYRVMWVISVQRPFVFQPAQRLRQQTVNFNNYRKRTTNVKRRSRAEQM